MNIKNHYPVYMQGELIALYPKTQTKKNAIKLSQTTTARRIKCAARRVLNNK